MPSDLSHTASATRDAFLLRLRVEKPAVFEGMRAVGAYEAEVFARVEQSYIDRQRALAGDDREDLNDSAFARPEAEASKRITLRGGEPPAPPGAAAAQRALEPLPELPPSLRSVMLGGDVPPTHAELLAAIGTKFPGQRALEQRAENEARKRRELEQRQQVEATRKVIRDELGEWTKEERKRLEQLKPETEHDQKDAKRLGKTEWAIARQASTGSARDLAYAISQMIARVPIEALGCWIVEAMGMQADGKAIRQLYSPKARRKLVRSFAMWTLGQNMRLRQIAGSPSRRTVRATKRAPQRLFARLAAVGGRMVHRSTTTRDANEAHAAGLYRRVRVPHSLAHPSECCGSSGQVVSRYWMELPRQLRPRSRMAAPDFQLGAFFEGCGIDEDPLGWVREHAQNAIVYAMRSVTTVRRRLGELVTIPGLLAPLLHAPP
jgi:hypothetical protein